MQLYRLMVELSEGVLQLQPNVHNDLIFKKMPHSRVFTHKHRIITVAQLRLCLEYKKGEKKRMTTGPRTDPPFGKPPVPPDSQRAPASARTGSKCFHSFTSNKRIW